MDHDDVADYTMRHLPWGWKGARRGTGFGVASLCIGQTVVDGSLKFYLGAVRSIGSVSSN